MAWTAPSHFLSQYWNIVNSNLRNKRQWNLKAVFIHFHSRKCIRKCRLLNFVSASMFWRDDISSLHSQRLCTGRHDMEKFPLYWSFVTGIHRWGGGFPSWRASDSELWCWCPLFCHHQQAVEQTIKLPVIWVVMSLKYRHCNETVCYGCKMIRTYIYICLLGCNQH